MRSPNPIGASRGFTLVEILAATLLLSIGLLAVMSAAQAARETQRRALYLSIGRNIAQSKIDRLRSTPISSITSQAGTSTDPSLPKGNSVQVAVSRYPNTGVPDLYKGTVTVTWPEHKGTRRIRYETLIVRR